MTEFEIMQGRVRLLEERVRRLEVTARYQGAATADEREAQRIAEEVGFPVEILIVPTEREKRIVLARDLAVRGWSAARIARVLRCCERTIERWLAGELNKVERRGS